MEVSTTWIAGSCITGGKEWMVYGNVHEASVFAIGYFCVILRIGKLLFVKFFVLLP